MIPEKGDGASGLVVIKSCGQPKSSTNKVKSLRPKDHLPSQRDSCARSVTSHSLCRKEGECLIRDVSRCRELGIGALQ